MHTHEHPSDDGIDGGYIQFQTAVLRQLPRPNEIDRTTRQGWMMNQKSLQDALHGALVPPKVEPTKVESGNLFVTLPTIELERYKRIEREYTKLCEDLGLKDTLDKVGDLTVDEVFTRERVERLGFKSHNLNRIGSLCRYWDGFGDDAKPITTLRQLATLTRSELRRQPNFGETGIQIIEAVLAEYGLKLGMTAIPTMEEQK